MSEQEIPDNEKPDIPTGGMGVTWNGIRIDPTPVTFHANLAPGWNSGATYQQPVYQPSNTFPTEESLRAFVKRCVAKYLDEKIDERVAKALDELAREMNRKELQPGTGRKEAGKE